MKPIIENSLWGIGGSIITAAILGVWNWLVNRRNDSIQLKATVTQPGDSEIIERIGCACMIITIKSTGKRIAKIGGAVVVLQGVDLIPQFEKAFGADFNYVPAGVGKPALEIETVPLREFDCSDGFILERDDVVRFAMPIRVPILDRFPTAPSQDVYIAVKLFDGEEQVILRGLRVQTVIAELIEDWSHKAQKLNVNLKIGLRANSKVRPGNNAELMGKRNSSPLIFFPEDTPQEVKDRIEGKAGTTTMAMPVYSFLREDSSSAVMLDTADGLLLPIFSTIEIANEVKSKARIGVTVIEFTSNSALSSFLHTPPGRPADGPDFNVLFDSVDANERKVGLIMRSDFLSSLRNPEPRHNPSCST